MYKFDPGRGGKDHGQTLLKIRQGFKPLQNFENSFSTTTTVSYVYFFKHLSLFDDGNIYGQVEFLQYTCIIVHVSPPEKELYTVGSVTYSRPMYMQA